MQSGIYKFTNQQNGLIYIGQSKNIWSRYGQHYFQAFSKPYEKIIDIDKAIRDNPEGFTFEIVELCPEELLTQRENYWIEYYNSREFGYNNTRTPLIYQFDLDGNLVGSYWGYTEAARAVGEPQGMGNIYKCCKGQILTSYGYKWSFSQDKAAEMASSPRILDNGRHSTQKRKVLQLDNNGNILNEFPSCAEAARAMLVSTGAICNACNGRAKSCAGYKWQYKEK